MKILKNIITPAGCAELLKVAEANRDRFNNSKGIRGKKGINGKQSIFHTWKYWNFTKEAKDVFTEAVPLTLRNKFNEAWFLRFDYNGFLDKYKSKGDLFTIWSIPLKDGQKMLIEDEEVMVNAGDVMIFDLNSYHEVPRVRTPEGDYYLVFIMMV